MGELPAGPRSIIPSFWRYLRDPYGVWSALARKWGDPFLLPIPGTPGTVVTGDPDGLRVIMGSDPDNFDAFRTDATEKLLGRNTLFFESGAAHRASRRVLAPPFRGDRMRTYGPLMESIVLNRTRDWTRGRRLSLQAETQWITLEVIIRAVFGISDEARVALMHRTISSGFDQVGPAVLFFKFLRHEFGGFGPWARAQRMVRGLMRIIEEELATRRASGALGDDVLSLMLQARYDDGAPLPDAEIRDKLYDMLIAGYETTAVALAWAGYEILHDRAIHARVRDEADAAGDDLDAIVRLPFLEAVIYESLRRHPNFVMLTRRAARPIALKGYTLPAGIGLSAAIGRAHFRDETFPEPFAFRPERFLGRSYSPFEYLPFGGNVQRCLGAAFALYQMKIVLATLFRLHELRLLRDPVPPKARAATVAPARGVELEVTSRRGAAQERHVVRRQADAEAARPVHHVAADVERRGSR
jgi:cytochrome P450 family 110